jgi:hypothetical protein
LTDFETRLERLEERWNAGSRRSTVRAVLIAAMSAMVGAFAPASANPPSTYLSSGKYREYTCPQLAEEAQSISRRVMALSGETQPSSHPAPVAGDEHVIIWPSALDDGHERTSEPMARAKEQMLAIEDASIQRQCDIEFLRSTH